MGSKGQHWAPASLGLSFPIFLSLFSSQTCGGSKVVGRRRGAYFKMVGNASQVKDTETRRRNKGLPLYCSSLVDFHCQLLACGHTGHPCFTPFPYA